MKHSEVNAISKNGKKSTNHPAEKVENAGGTAKFPIPRFPTLVHQLHCSPTRLRITICSTLSTADDVEKRIIYKQLPNFK